MPVVRWKILDPQTLVEVEFPLNPNQMNLPAREKSITSDTTTGPGLAGRTILFEGADVTGRIGFSGVALDLTQVEFFDDLWAHRHQVQLTDDLGRQWWVYPTRFEAQRDRKGTSSHLGRHTYNFEAIVLDWP